MFITCFKQFKKYIYNLISLNKSVKPNIYPLYTLNMDLIYLGTFVFVYSLFQFFIFQNIYNIKYGFIWKKTNIFSNVKMYSSLKIIILLYMCLYFRLYSCKNIFF